MDIEVSDGGKLERWVRHLARVEAEYEMVMLELVQRVVDGDSLRVIADDMGVPRGRLVGWVLGDEERRAVYEGALRMCADGLVHAALEAAPEERRSETMLRVAGLWDPQRFGKGGGSGGGVRVVVNRGGDSVTVTTEG